MNNIERCVKELGGAVVPISGTSMLPLLKEGKSLVELVEIGQKRLKKGDVVLFKKDNGTLVLHRIIKLSSEDSFTVLGDNQFKNPEHITKNQIIALAKGFFINGRYIDEKTRWYRVYKKIWNCNLNLRRCFLAFLRFKKK